MPNKQKSVLGLIPAKGTSRRLPRKNIKLLRGVPLFLYAFNALLGSGLCDRIILSSDDPRIMEAAKEAGVDVPFIRPKSLAKDPVEVDQVALHCLNELEEQYDILMIALPTSPMITGPDFEDAYNIFMRLGAKRMVGLAEMDHNPFRAMHLRNGDFVEPMFPNYFDKIRPGQLPQTYRIIGMHILDVPAFKQTRSYTAQPLAYYKVSWEKGIDIDTVQDFMMVSAVLGRENNGT